MVAGLWSSVGQGLGGFVNGLFSGNSGNGSIFGNVANTLISNVMNQKNAAKNLANQYKYQSLLNDTAYKRQLGMNTTAYKRQNELNRIAYKYSVALQNKQNSFQQMMFDQSAKLAASAHQIEVEDMRKAGLNPILSATGGNGATAVSPMSGSSTTVSGGSAPNGSAPNGSVGLPSTPEFDLISAVDSAKSASRDFKRVHNESRMTGSNIDLNQSQTNLTNTREEGERKRNENIEQENEDRHKLNEAQIKTEEKKADYIQAQAEDLANQRYNRDRQVTGEILLNSAKTTQINHQNSQGNILGEKLESFYNDHPGWANTANFLNEVGKAAGTVFGGAGAGVSTYKNATSTPTKKTGKKK